MQMPGATRQDSSHQLWPHEAWRATPEEDGAQRGTALGARGADFAAQDVDVVGHRVLHERPVGVDAHGLDGEVAIQALALAEGEMDVCACRWHVVEEKACVVCVWLRLECLVGR